jgi:hypothetical protein
MSAADPMKDPLAFGRQLWQQWNAAVQGAAPMAMPHMAQMPQMPDWRSALGQWGELAGGGSFDATRAAEKLGVHGQQFFGLMQELMQRAGAGATPAADLSALWRGQLGDGNPMLDALRQVSAEGARGWEQLSEAARNAAQPVTTELLATLKLPGFGLGRERQAEVGDLVAAQIAQGEAVQAYQRLLLKASEAGLERFEGKLAEHSEPGRQIASMRALYDLWIDAAEEAYAEIALSPAFREAYGKLVNTQMRVKQLQQKEVARAAAELGMPTRSELDGVLRRLHELQRDLRSLRSAVASGAASSSIAPVPAAAPAQPAARSKAKTPKSAVAKSTRPASRPTKAKQSASAGAGGKAVAAGAPAAPKAVKAKTKDKPKPKAKAVPPDLFSAPLAATAAPKAAADTSNSTVAGKPAARRRR